MRRKRLALTPDEVKRLLAVAGVRELAYRLALGTGLRRRELQRPQWRGVLVDDTDRSCLTLRPSDPVGAMQYLIAAVLALSLQQGIENSLDSKLDAAQQALDDLNEDNNVAAINSLQAFINAVQAQSGVHIPADDANALVAAAQQIIDVLSA